jgi:antitoxin VapB
VKSARTKIFKSGNSVAVRLPKGIDFPEGTEVEIVKVGNNIEVRPTRLTFEQMVDELAKLPKPSSIEVRDTEEIPERPGL